MKKGKLHLYMMVHYQQVLMDHAQNLLEGLDSGFSLMKDSSNSAEKNFIGSALKLILLPQEKCLVNVRLTINYIDNLPYNGCIAQLVEQRLFFNLLVLSSSLSTPIF